LLRKCRTMRNLLRRSPNHSILFGLMIKHYNATIRLREFVLAGRRTYVRSVGCRASYRRLYIRRGLR
jgi:hypothetical protein